MARDSTRWPSQVLQGRLMQGRGTRVLAEGDTRRKRLVMAYAKFL